MKAKRSAKKAAKVASAKRASAKRSAVKTTKSAKVTAAKATKPAKVTKTAKRGSDSGKAVPLPHLRERWPRTAAERKARAAEYYKRLSATYPDAHCALDHEDAYQLLVATILSAQCTDKRVNLVTPALFKHYPSATRLADADREELETEIKSTGFFRSKTKSLLGMAQALVARHGGTVPDSMEELTELPGVGRKTANVVLGNVFHKNLGIVVDTHVTRFVGAARTHARDRCREDRGGPDAALSVGRVDDAVAPVDRARAPDLLRASAAMRGVRAQRHLPVVAGVTARDAVVLGRWWQDLGGQLDHHAGARSVAIGRSVCRGCEGLAARLAFACCSTSTSFHGWSIHGEARYDRDESRHHCRGAL